MLFVYEPFFNQSKIIANMGKVDSIKKNIKKIFFSNCLDLLYCVQSDEHYLIRFLNCIVFCVGCPRLYFV